MRSFGRGNGRVVDLRRTVVDGDGQCHRTGLLRQTTLGGKSGFAGGPSHSSYASELTNFALPAKSTVLEYSSEVKPNGS